MAEFEQRCAILVDVQNMFYSAKHQFGGKINFDHLLEATSRRRKIVRAIAYAVKTPEIDQEKFVKLLYELGFEVKMKDLKVRADGTAKGDWDMGIAIDAISLVDRVDCMVLVSGDGDYVPLVEHLKARGCRVEVYSFKVNTATELINAATEFFPMDDSFVFRMGSRDRK
ncbi:MAG TPA: NYN domain-containing protein [Firmicutes bacterium]|nr:NYN domain-containing protein [Bacillota bacterium]